MAKNARAGELRTRITVMDWPADTITTATSDGLDADGYPLDDDGYRAQERVNVFGVGGYRQCKWVNAHGSEVYEAHQAGVTEPATLTMRYTDKITPTSLIYRGSDPRPYEVIGVNDVEGRHVWLEVKVQRRSPSI